MTDRTEAVFSLGWWIRRRRKALDLTQVALANCVGCAEISIRKLEADARRPSRVIAERLADCLAIAPDDRELFLQVACAERCPDRLPISLNQLDPVSRSIVQIQRVGESIPLDTVPLPAPLPSGSRMPLRCNPLFVGREADLRALAQAFHAGGTTAIGHRDIAAATGLGGIGKTQLACEFVHRYGQFFAGGVFWLSFADPAAVPAEVAACGGAASMDLCPGFATLPINEQVQQVLRAWASPTPRLLVFDNCEDEALLAQWRPTHGGCRVLLTSRRRHWDAALGVYSVPLNVLPRTDSLALLCAFRPDLSTANPDLQAIAETLGDLPLALHLAGSFLAKYRHAITPAQYLQRLYAPTILDDRSLQEAGLSPTQHVQHVARTFEQSHERLDAADPLDALARTLLSHAACFAPGEPLPRWLLVDTLQLRAAHDQSALLTEDALTRLIDLGLLETDDAGVLRLHRLLAAFVQAVLVDSLAQAAVEATILEVADDLNERRNPRALLAVQPHLRCITEAAQGRADTRSAGICNALGYHLWLLGVYTEARCYLEQAVATRRRVLGDDHPDTATSLSNLGAVLEGQGQYAEAQHAYEQALAIRQRVLGDDHPDTATSLNNLGGVFWEQGQYAETQRYVEQALAIRQRVLGADHPHTAMNLNSLGVVLEEQGQYAEAQHAYEQALAIRQRVLGDDHPDTATSFNNLGGVHNVQGQYAEAQCYHEQALAIWQRVLGADHPDTAGSLNNLGLVLKEQGQYAEAQRYHEQALAIWQRVLGADHPHTAMSLNNLAEVLEAQGQYAEAQDYVEQALVIRQHVLDTDHPHTARSLHTLGVVLEEQGQYAEALRALEQALAIRQRVLGADHPDTARSLRALGELLLANGEKAQARHYLEQALAIFLERLAPQHPDIARTEQIFAALDAECTAIEQGSGG